jgi:hypothetical protein
MADLEVRSRCAETRSKIRALNVCMIRLHVDAHPTPRAAFITSAFGGCSASVSSRLARKFDIETVISSVGTSRLDPLALRGPLARPQRLAKSETTLAGA